MFGVTIKSGNTAPMYKYVHEQLIKLWKHSTRAFLEAALESMQSNIDTGMSVASFRAAAAAIQERNTLMELMRGFGPKRGHKGLTGEWASNNASQKSAALGERLGKKAYTLKFGTPRNMDFQFEFHIVVFQHYLHESTTNYSKSLNWDTLKKGKEAFNSYFENNFEAYVDVNKIGNILLESIYG